MSPLKNTDGPGSTGPAANNSDLHHDGTPLQVVARFLRLLLSPGDLFEVRAPKCRTKPGGDFRHTVSGYYTFDNIDAAAAAIAKLDAEGTAPGIYVTMNPVNPALLARANCRLERGARFATGDGDVVRRLWMLIDCDPIRPADVSSTDAELALAQAKALAIASWLKDQGWPDPIIILSGNGYHLLYRIDLPTEEAGLVKTVLEGLATRFDDEHVKIDRSVFNAARITKVAGTMARKGDDLRGIRGVEDRPHRRSAIVSVPEIVGVVTREQLELVVPPDDGGAAQRSAPKPLSSTPSRGSFERFDHTAAGVRGYMERHGVAVKGEKPSGGATYLLLERCPVVPECVSGNGTDIAVIVSASGVISYKNFHSRGTRLEWVDVREALEPGYKAFAAGRPPPVPNSAPASIAVPTRRALPIPSYRAFPVEALPRPVSPFVAGAARALNCDPAYVALPVTAALASCVGTSRRLILKRAWREFCIIWAVIVGRSGTIKSPALDAALTPLRLRQSHDLANYQLQTKLHDDALLEYERARDLYKRGKSEERPTKPAAPVCPRRIVSDVTIEGIAPILQDNARGVLLARDELAGWVKGFDAYRGGRGGDVAKWLEMHRAGELLVDRKTGASRVIYVPRAAVSVTGSIQPYVLLRVLDPENLANGFAARLLTCAPPKKVKVWTDADIDPALAASYDDVVDGLLKLEHQRTDAGLDPLDLDFTPGARKGWIKFYNEFGIEQASLGDEDLAAAFSKLEGYCARFTLLIHLIRVVSGDRSVADPNRVDEASLEAARTITEWFCYETDRVHGMLGEGDAQQDVRVLIELIERMGGSISVRQLQQAGRRWRASADVARAALDSLVKAGLARWERPPPSAQGGHPTEVCRLVGAGNGNTTPTQGSTSGGSVTVTGKDDPEEEVGQWTA